VVRTFFFVIFGITIVLTSLLSTNVAMVSILIIASIYVIRFLILRVFIGKDIMPQVFIAPRGLITILLFYAIPVEAEIAGFESGVLLFVIIATSLIMTGAMILDKKKMGTLLDEIEGEMAARNKAEDALRVSALDGKVEKAAAEGLHSENTAEAISDKEAISRKKDVRVEKEDAVFEDEDAIQKKEKAVLKNEDGNSEKEDVMSKKEDATEKKSFLDALSDIKKDNTE